jgi:hypothetical protein
MPHTTITRVELIADSAPAPSITRVLDNNDQNGCG